MLLLLALESRNATYSFSGARGNVDITVGSIDASAPAFAVFQDHNETAAQFHLLVQTNKDYPSSEQAYFAGFAEGFVTGHLIEMHNTNLKHDMVGEGVHDWDYIILDYSNVNFDYVRKNVEEQKDSVWWRSVGYVMLDWVDGMADGAYKAGANVTRNDIFIMNAYGDYGDIENLYKNATSRLGDKFADDMPHHCSATVRHSPTLDDVWFSQDSWTNFYQGFLRIAKTYKFNWDLQFTKQYNVTFSSYPGYFFSMDDFYIVHNSDGEKTINMAVLETTFRIFNESLFDFMDKYGNHSVLTWVRTQLANMQSMRPDQWNLFYNTYQSWTYNNNYLFLNYSAVELVRDSGSNYQERRDFIERNNISLLHSLEVVPMKPTFWDCTDAFLSQKFYISINTPINESVADYDGYTTKNSTYYMYNTSARTCIAFRDLPHVDSYQRFYEYVRFNDYLHDACSRNDPGQSIAARYDWRNQTLCQQTPSLSGCTDSKTTSLSLAKDLVFDFVVGPIRDGPSHLEPFNFSSAGTPFIEYKGYKPLGYFDVFPNKWTRVASYQCLETECKNGGTCVFGTCECKATFTGALCEQCAPGYSLSAGKCLKEIDSALIVGLSVGIPLGVMFVVGAVWVYFAVRKAKKPQGPETDSASERLIPE